MAYFCDLGSRALLRASKIVGSPALWGYTRGGHHYARAFTREMEYILTWTRRKKVIVNRVPGRVVFTRTGVPLRFEAFPVAPEQPPKPELRPNRSLADINARRRLIEATTHIYKKLPQVLNYRRNMKIEKLAEVIAKRRAMGRF